MFIKEVTVQNQVGLHARPATFFIQKANEYKSSIWISRDERKVNAKSLLGVMSLSVITGSEVVLSAEGVDEVDAVEALEVLLQNDIAAVPFKLTVPSWPQLRRPYSWHIRPSRRPYRHRCPRP